MGNIISSNDNGAALKIAYDANQVIEDRALSLANGDTAINQKLIVTGTSTFNDDITIATGKKINGIDVGTLNTSVTTLQSNVQGMNSAVSGDFTGKSITGVNAVTTSGMGTFGSVKTSDIDINGNITSSSGKSFITTADATGIKFTNGLPVTDAKHAFQSIDSATGDINFNPGGIGKRLIVNGTGTNKVTIADGLVSAGMVNPGSGLRDFWGTLYVTPSQVKYGKTILNSDSLTVPAVTASGAVTAGSVNNSGALTNTGALKLGTNKWLINEVVDATKGTRLCFGSEDGSGRQVYWTCINNAGNLERF